MRNVIFVEFFPRPTPGSLWPLGSGQVAPLQPLSRSDQILPSGACRLPPLLVFEKGPCIEHILHELVSPSHWYTQLLGDIWRGAVEQVSAFNKVLFPRCHPSTQHSPVLKGPSSFEDLAESMAALLDLQATLFKRYATAAIAPLVPGLVLYLDNIEWADALDEGLGLRLLNMREVRPS